MAAAALSALAGELAGVDAWLASNLFEVAPVAIAVVDAERRVIRANGNFVAVFGAPAGRTCHQIYKRRTEPCPGCALAKTLRDGKSRVTEEQGVDCLGQPASFVVHHLPVASPEGAVTHVVNMSYDVTDRTDLQHQMNLIFERAPCALSVINRDLRIVRANEEVRRRFGEAVGARCYQIYKQRAKRCDECPALATFADGRPHSSRQVRRAGDGTATYHLVSTAPLPHAEREAGHVIEMSLDVTEAHVLSEKLLESARLAAVGQTVTQLAHSIKNILTGLQGGLYDIKTGQQRGDAARVGAGVATLERNFTRVTELVHDFLRFSKEHLPEVARVDVTAVAAEVHALYRHLADKHGIAFRLEAEGGIEPAWVDRRGLHTCLANLVENAFEACRGVGSACRIALRVREEIKAEGPCLVLEVEDSGCGMEPELVARLFRGIFTSKGPSGTGLGLMMTRKIVEDHGGTIAVDSSPGQGSCFRIELPRTRLPTPENGGREPALED